LFKKYLAVQVYIRRPSTYPHQTMVRRNNVHTWLKDVDYDKVWECVEKDGTIHGLHGAEAVSHRMFLAITYSTFVMGPIPRHLSRHEQEHFMDVKKGHILAFLSQFHWPRLK